MVNNSNWNSTRHKKVGHAEILAYFIQHRSELWPGWAHEELMIPTCDTYNWWEMSTDSSQEECQHCALSTLSTIGEEGTCVSWECYSINQVSHRHIDFLLFLHRTYASVASNCSFDNSISIQPITTIHISMESLWKGQTFICGMCTTLN